MAKITKVYYVEPLRTAEEIEEMKWAIRRGNKGAPKRPALAARDDVFFLIGINTELRVNDLVRLHVRDSERYESLFYTGRQNKEAT